MAGSCKLKEGKSESGDSSTMIEVGTGGEVGRDSAASGGIFLRCGSQLS